MLPLSLQNRIQSLLLSSAPKSSLIKARENLTDRYRAKQDTKTGGFASSFEAIAYVAARMPATFAAVQTVLSHVPLDNITSILDLGAGPGTAALAAGLHWTTCNHLHLVEGDNYMSKLSQSLLQDLPEIAHQTTSFQTENLLTVSLGASYDLTLLSYVLNELSLDKQRIVLNNAWSATMKCLVILMPGTPVGYQQLMVLREFLIEAGAFIAAPCPHHKACPLKEGDWCHFSTRLPRSSYHREIKNVSLPFEDEKYSYLVALRNPLERSLARIIRKPMQRSGHVTLDLCTSEGLRREIVSRRDKEVYKAATKSTWGDSWSEQKPPIPPQK